MEITAHEKRKFPRKPMQGEGEIDNTIPDESGHIKMLDISLGGISCLSSSAFEEGKRWLVSFSVENEIITVIIRIAYCVKHGLADAYRLGAEFRWLDAGQTKIVEQHLSAA